MLHYVLIHMRKGTILKDRRDMIYLYLIQHVCVPVHTYMYVPSTHVYNIYIIYYILY
jgi:hypothetical protein